MKSYCIWCNTGWKLLYLMWCQFCLFFWKWDRWAGIGILKWAEKTIEILWAVGWKCDGIIHVGSHVMVHGGRHVIVHGGSNTSSSQVIIHVAIIRDVYFRHRKWVWVGLWGQGHSMTVSKRHGSNNLWRKFKERHEVWSVTLNTWCYLKSS